MRKRFLMWLSRSCWFLVFTVISISCNDGFETGSNSKVKTSVTAASNAEMVAAAQEVMDITGAGMVDQGITYGRVADNDNYDRERCLCGAVVSKSIEINSTQPDSLIITGSISIDFGDGTHCRDSVERRHGGKITTQFNIHVNVKTHAYSSVETVTLENFKRRAQSINGVFIARAASGGMRWLDIINAQFTHHGHNDEGEDEDDDQGEDEDDDNEADSVSVTWTWNGNLTFTRNNGGTISHDDDFKTVTGTISATADNGASFSSEITSAITFKWACFHGRNIPVMGTMSITNNGVLTTLDFGDGACDKIYVATTNGVVTEHHF